MKLQNALNSDLKKYDKSTFTLFRSPKEAIIFWVKINHH